MLSSKDKDKDKTKTKAKAKEKRQAETSDKPFFMSFATFLLGRNLPGNLVGNLATTWSLTQKTLTNMGSVNERKSC
jgi:hypothetical protein